METKLNLSREVWQSGIFHALILEFFEDILIGLVFFVLLTQNHVFLHRISLMTWVRVNEVTLTLPIEMFSIGCISTR